jgi:hypothetical protein
MILARFPGRLFAISTLFLVALADERGPSGAIRPPPYAKVDLSLVRVEIESDTERQREKEKRFLLFSLSYDG